MEALRRIAGDESGFSLVELLVAAVIVVLTSLAVLGGIDAATSASGEQRSRASAHGIAEQDQARLRSLRIDQLGNLTEQRVVEQDGVTFTVDSRGEFATDSTGTTTCEQGASADYLRITSTVSWPTMGSRPPSKISSIVAPRSGSISPDEGALAISVVNSNNDGISGVGIGGSGPGSFSGTTNAFGCLIIGGLQSGNYSVTLTAPGLVDVNGNAPQPTTVGVVGFSTNSIVFQLDDPGSVTADFTTFVGGQLETSEADSLVAFNTGLESARSFGDPGTSSPTVVADTLFPFSSPYTVYAGACTSNNPNPTNLTDPPAAEALADVTVPPGGSETATLQLPGLELNVWDGQNGTSPGNPVPDAQVVIVDTACLVDGDPVTRTYTADANGELDIGLPWGKDYDICASDANVNRTLTGRNVDQTDYAKDYDIYLGDLGQIQPGPCPL